MKTICTIALLLVLLGTNTSAQEHEQRQPATTTPVRFEAVDIYIDSGDEALAAYQFEFAAEKGNIAIVGVEGGEHAAFREPPYYDPAALSKNRIIIAAFNTGSDLPKGKTRVARLHVRVVGHDEPEYVVKLEVSASAEGQRIPATVMCVKGERK